MFMESRFHLNVVGLSVFCKSIDFSCKLIVYFHNRFNASIHFIHFIRFIFKKTALDQTQLENIHKYFFVSKNSQFQWMHDFNTLNKFTKPNKKMSVFIFHCMWVNVAKTLIQIMSTIFYNSFDISMCTIFILCIVK